jgi:hypothetical protein
MAKQKLDEKRDKEVLDGWRQEAAAMTVEKLPEFLRKLREDYVHDYGTICHAIAAAGIAAMKSVNRSPQGGITGFQAGCIMWGVIVGWMTHYEGHPLVLHDFHDMLYPQQQDKFTTISQDTWDWLQKQAAGKMNGAEGLVADGVVAHWQSIVDGKVPFGYTVRAEGD